MKGYQGRYALSTKLRSGLIEASAAIPAAYDLVHEQKGTLRSTEQVLGTLRARAVTACDVPTSGRRCLGRPDEQPQPRAPQAIPIGAGWCCSGPARIRRSCPSAMARLAAATYAAAVCRRSPLPLHYR